jgi:RecB family exonuclease
LLTLPGIRRELASRTVFSAGQLERYARCPFTWFLSDLVGLEDLEPELDALRLGALVHDVLAHTYQGLQSEGLLPLVQAGLARAEELLDHNLDKGLLALEVYGTAAERRLARQEASARLRLLLRFDSRSGSRLRPRWLERRFGSGDGVDLGGLHLVGRMDRIDASPDGKSLFVIDYKNGSAVFGPSFAKDGALQVPLYMLALQALHPDATVIGGVYAALGSNLRGGMALEDAADLLGAWRPGNPVSGERFRTELDSCLIVAKEAAEGIRGAVIPAAPSAGCPRYCDLRPLCGGPVRRPAEALALEEEAPPEPGAASPSVASVGSQLSLLEDRS